MIPMTRREAMEAGLASSIYYRPTPDGWALDDAKATRQFQEEGTVDADGVFRWNSNGAVPPKDCLNAFRYLELPFKMGATLQAREAQLEEATRRYREAQARRTPEQVAEERAMARAAHGPGVELVNVLTGERYTT